MMFKAGAGVENSWELEEVEFHTLWNIDERFNPCFDRESGSYMVC